MILKRIFACLDDRRIHTALMWFALIGDWFFETIDTLDFAVLFDIYRRNAKTLKTLLTVSYTDIYCGLLFLADTIVMILTSVQEPVLTDSPIKIRDCYKGV